MTNRIGIGIITLMFAFSAPSSYAQEEPSAGQSGQSIEEAQPAVETPDSRSFQGTEQFSPGHAGNLRSYILPSLSISEMADSNSQTAPGKQHFEAITSIIGRLTFGKIGRHTNISADYLGGEAIYTHRSVPSATMHQLGITGSYTGRRWSFTVDDRATYLPESGFGFGGFGYTGGLGLSLGGAYSSNLGELNSVFNPTGALLTGRGNRILNTSVVQVQYATSPQTSISVSGSYSILHFTSPGFFDTKTSTFMTSFSHAMNARDYVGLSYGFSWYQLQSSVPAFQTHFVQASYGHRISGRMALQVGAGPLIQKFSSPLTGAATRTSWMATSSLDYRALKGSLGLSYSHYTTGGGGVLLGAQTDSVRASWGVPFRRKWQLSIGPGFAHNRSLPQTAVGGIESKYNSFYGTSSISRSLGRNTSVFLTYNYQAQRREEVPCITTNCNGSSARHMIGFGFNFHPRQLNFD